MGKNLIEINWHANAKVFKWTPKQTAEVAEYLGRQPVYADFVELGVAHEDFAEADGNVLTTAGLTRITNLLIGGGAAAFTHAQSFCGVGNSSTTALAADVDLNAAAGSTNRWFQATDASNPSVAAGVISCNTTFGGSDGNFAWNEWTLGVATGTITATAVLASVGTSPIMLNHKNQSLGTKAAASTWTLQATITLV